MAKNKNRISKQQHVEAPPKPKNFIDRMINVGDLFYLEQEENNN